MFNSLSDRETKINIRSLNYNLDTVLKLKPKKFEMKDDGTTSIGLIAQEVERVVPEVVVKHGDFKGINYPVLVAVLINAIKELNDKVEELRQK